MSDPAHLRVARRGSAAISEWRERNPGVRLDLSGADLAGINLESGHLRHARLEQASLRAANLTAVNLWSADLTDADLTDADLSGAFILGADLTNAKLVGARLWGTSVAGAELIGADLSGAELIGADLSGATIGLSYFSACDLSGGRGLDRAQQEHPTSIATDTLLSTLRGCGGAFTSEIRAFFIKAGVSGSLLDYLPSLYAAHPIRFHSVFISYADKDEPAPSQLYDDLKRAGVPIWKFNHDALPGGDTEDIIDRQIAARDKVVLLCSRNSLDRPWVLQEVERARIKERDLRGRIGERRKTDPGFDVDWRVLFPVMLDDYALHGWRPIDAHIGELVRSRNIADLRYPPGSVGWQAEVRKIVRALDPNSRRLETLAPSARPAL